MELNQRFAFLAKAVWIRDNCRDCLEVEEGMDFEIPFPRDLEKGGELRRKQREAMDSYIHSKEALDSYIHQWRFDSYGMGMEREWYFENG